MQQLNSSRPSDGSTAADWSPVTLATGALLGLCCALEVPGNAAVLVVLGRRLRRGSFTMQLMLSLAVSDLLSLLTLPLWIATLLRGWTFGTALCKLISYLVYGSLFTSVLSVTLLSVQRYLQVLHSQRWARLGPGGQRALLGGVWVLGAALASSALVQYRVVVKESDGRPHCEARFGGDGERVVTRLLESVLGFVAPFSVMASFYFCLHRRVNQTAFFSSQRMTRLVTSIVVTFFIFWVPVHVNNALVIAAIWFKSGRLLRFSEVSDGITGALTFINSCVNPFLYAFSARALRQGTPETTSVLNAPQPETTDTTSV